MLASMIRTATLAALLLPAIAAANPTNAPRKAYLGCLDQFLRKSLEAKMPAGEFEKAVVPACADKEDAFRKAFIAYDARDGISAKESDEMVSEEIGDFRNNTNEMYREYMSSGTRPA